MISYYIQRFLTIKSKWSPVRGTVLLAFHEVNPSSLPICYQERKKGKFNDEDPRAAGDESVFRTL